MDDSSSSHSDFESEQVPFANLLRGFLSKLTTEEESDTSEEESDTSEEESGPGLDGDDANQSCPVCHKKAVLSCRRCNDEYYCSKSHLKRHKEIHMDVCFKKQTNFLASNDSTSIVDQSSPLLTLPEDALLQICRFLSALDLVRLGLVCSRLRCVSRDAAAWSHVRFIDYQQQSTMHFNFLKIAPAFHTVAIRSRPPVDLLRGPKRVNTFDLEDWDEEELSEPYGRDDVIRVLDHYRGHLQVLKLRSLTDVRLLAFIDSLQIRELHVREWLVKAYPGSGRVVTQLSDMIFDDLSEEVLTQLLSACKETLTVFKLRTFPDDIDGKPWSVDEDSPVLHALKSCSALEDVRIGTWWKTILINDFPKLRKLCVYDFGDENHASSRDLLLGSPLLRNLDSLTLHLGCQAHRGLIQAAARACSNLTELSLLFTGEGKMKFVYTVDIPRDLHLLLGWIPHLETLVLSAARIPFTFFKGLTGGALPNLRLLSFRYCTGTVKAMAALEELKAGGGGRSSAAALEVDGELRPAQRRQFHDASSALLMALFLPSDPRCKDPACEEPSDCEEDDPLPGPLLPGIPMGFSLLQAGVAGGLLSPLVDSSDSDSE